MKCRKCGFQGDAADNFCRKCGQPLTEAPPARDEPAQEMEAAAGRGGDLSAFGEHVGERRNVTIVMADISGYSRLADALEPEEASEIAGVFFEHWVPIIHKYGGHRHKYMGDQLFALFGAPMALENAPQMALRASLEMREGLEEINREINERFPGRLSESLSAHMGVNSGIVYWGEIGPEGTRDVMGPAVNVAYRLQEISQPGEILVSEETWQLTGTDFHFAPKGKQLLQGREQKIELYQLVGMRSISAPRREVELVGRERELRILSQVLEGVGEGKSRIVGVVGEAGIGKSRVVAEFAKRAEKETTVLQAHCLSYGGNMPYLPFAELVSGCFSIEEADEELVGLGKIEAQLARLGCPTEDLHSFGAILGYEESRASLPHVTDRERREMTARATQRLLSALADPQPVVVVLEDVHWIDDTSRDLLERLSREMRDKAVMFLLTFRPGFESPCGGAERYQEVVIERLPEHEGERLVESLLQRYSLDSRVKGQALQRSQGNPLCMVEIVRSLREAGGAALSDEELEGLLNKVPARLWDIIMSRIDRLESHLKHVVLAASVVGIEFSQEVLGAVVGLEEEEVVTALQKLVEVEMLRHRPDSQEEEWEFEHPLVQEVAYQSLIRGDKMRLHLRVGEAMERLYGGEARRLRCEILARHFYEGRQPDKAAEYNSLAAERGRENFAYPEALRFCEKALEMLEVMPPSDKTRELRIRVFRSQGLVWQFQGKNREARGNFVTCLRLAREMGNATLFADAHFNLGHAEFLLGEMEKAKEYLTMALRLWQELGAADEVARAHVGVGACLFELSDHEGALKHFEESRNLQKELGIPEDPSPVANTGDIYMRMGDYERAVESYQKALELARARGREDKRGEAYPSLGLALALENQGDHAASLEPARRALELAEQMGEKFLESLVNCEMAHFLFHLGRYEEGLERGEKALTLAEEIGNDEYAGQARVFLARIWAELGQEEKALTMLKEAADDAETKGIGRIVALASWCTGEILGCFLRDWDASHQHYLKARHIFQRLKMRKEEAMTAIGCAGAEGRLGHHEKADQECRQIHERLEKMGSKDGMVTGFLTLGQVWEAAERYELASRLYRQCWEMGERIEDPSFCWKALSGLSRTAKGQGLEADSAEYARLAQRAAGSILSNLRNPELRETFAATLERRMGVPSPSEEKASNCNAVGKRQ